LIKETKYSKDNSKKMTANQPSNDTYITSPLHYDVKNNGNDETSDNEKLQVSLLNDDDGEYNKNNRRRNNKKGRKGVIQSLPSSIVQKRLITLRSTLLALSLSLTLLVFWLLDSLKDPTFATMVEGNLNKHQPLAKMASVGGTLVLVIFMEIVSNGKRKRGGQDSETMKTEEEILSGGGVWTKMAIGSEGDNSEDDCLINDNKIPITIFRFVGIAYISLLGMLSYFISLHPDFRGDVDAIATDFSSDKLKSNSAWYFLGYLQYIIIESYGSIAVATFWSFANSTLTLNAAKTYYGFIIALAQLGAIGGSTLATLPNVSIPRLFTLACFGILIQMGTMHIYGIHFPYPMNEEDDAIFHNDEDGNDYESELKKKAAKDRHSKQSILENSQSTNIAKSNDSFENSLKMFLSGVFLILKYNYLLLILGVSCLYEVSLTCLDYEMKLIGLDHFSAPLDVIGDINEAYTETESTADAFATFMGRYGQLTNLLSLLLSYYLFPYLMQNYGLRHALRIFPTLLIFIMFMTYVALPMNLPVLFISMSILKAMTYSINDPAKEILYIPTSNVVKFKAKFWIDVVGARFAKAIGSSINTYAGTAERVVQYGSLPSVATAVALWLVCYAAGMKFDELLEKGEIVGIEEDEAEISFSSFSHDEEYSDDENENDENDYTSESGWESNATVELVRTNFKG
jgi:ATP/ADP translocase